MSENALAVAKDYPAEKYNLLIPVKTMQELSPLHKMVINEVQISNKLPDKDVYEQNKELALTKKALMKLMAAANIQVIESKPIPTQRCNKCIDIAQRTRLAPKCFECPYIDDVAYQVTIAVPELSGTYRIVKATKEIRMEDAKEKMTDYQFASFKPFRTEQCESKALNRALREGLMLKATYTAKELEKPFAVGLVMPNTADPELKQAMIERYANNVTALYGDVSPVAPAPTYAALPTASTVIEVVADDDIDEQGFIEAENVEAEVIGEGIPLCNDCNAEIVDTEGRGGKVWTAQDLIDLSMGHFNRPLCPKCYRKAAKEAKEGK